MTCAIYISATDVTICDNDIRSSTESGITVNGDGVNPIIHDNRIHNCVGWGVEARFGCEPFVHDNYIHDNRAGGISFDGASGRVAKNNISLNGHYGVMTTGGTIPGNILTIDNNQIRGHSTAGVSVFSGEVRITGNDIGSFPLGMSVGIEVSDAGVAHIVGNTITYCGSCGIFLNNAEAMPSHIVGNNIWDNTYGVRGGLGCAHGIFSSNIIIRNSIQDIIYNLPPCPFLTFNNNTFDTAPGAAQGSYNATSNGLPINP